ncbi:MAG: nucleotidyltransferase domain-containing protein [Candidatus Hydrogenedentes bacterium]|nr:nucleotidyltransferase domain-containing protein [Candidatus Hydrogenedentota bacterium]
MTTTPFQAEEHQRAAVRKLVEQIAAIPCVRRVILFGSRARGDADDRSDVDIAIDAPGITRPEWVAMLFAAEDADTLLEIQLVNLEEAEGKFRESIEVEGIVLYPEDQKQKPSGLTFLENVALICGVGLAASIYISIMGPLSHWLNDRLLPWWTYAGFAAMMTGIFGGGLLSCILIGRLRDNPPWIRRGR